MIQLPLDDRLKIDLGKPVLTLDVNQIALRPPSQRSPDHELLAAIEWNYFETERLEAAVTPETALEITGGIPDEQLGSWAYRRLEKSRWFKARPSGSTLALDAKESNDLWLDMRRRLWPNVTDTRLTDNQRADVSQVFAYTVASGSTVAHSAFITLDTGILAKAAEFRGEYGIWITTPSEAWKAYEGPYDLVRPTPAETDALWKQQSSILNRLRSGNR